MSGPLRKRIWRILAGSVLALVLVVGLAVLGAFIWLRTSSGEKYVADLLTQTLAAQGLVLEMAEFSGPLPSRITARGIRLSDGQGLFFTAERMDLDLKLSALMSRTVQVEDLALTGPVLLRPPVLPETPETSSPGGPLDFSLTLPVKIVLGKLKVDRGSVPWELLGLDGPAPETSPPLGGPALPDVFAQARRYPLNINVAASGSLEHGLLRVALKADLSAGPDLRVDLKLDSGQMSKPEAGSAEATAGLVVTVSRPGRHDQMALELKAVQHGQLIKLDQLELDGLGLQGQISADYDLAKNALAAVLTFQGQDNAAWQSLLAELTGLKPSFLAGLGNPLAIQARLDSPDLGAFKLDLSELRAGVLKATGQAAFTPAAGDAPLSAGHVQAGFEVEVSDLGPLDLDMSGPLRASLEAAGHLEAVRGRISLSSPDLTTRAGQIKTLQAELAADMSIQDQAIRGSGQLSAHSSDGPAGPVDVATGWEIDLAGQPMSGTASVSNLKLAAFGLDLQGDLRAGLGAALLAEQAPQARSSLDIWPKGLTVDGALQVEVRDWAPLSALSGLDMNAQGGRLNLNMGSSSGRQNISAQVNLKSLAMPGQDLAVNSLDLNLEAALAGADPKLNLRLSTGPGSAGQFDWAGVKASVDGQGQSGDFSLLVQAPGSQNNDKNKVTSDKTQQKLPPPSKPELASVHGRYDLAGSQVVLNDLYARYPGSRVEAELRQPATLKFGPGIEAHDLDLEFKPGGSLQADFSMSPGKMEAKVKLADLPFSLINELTEAGLPDGALEASLDCRTGRQGPEGSILTELYLDKTASGQLPLSHEKAAARTPGQTPPDVRLQADLKPAGNNRLWLEGHGQFGFLDVPPATPTEGAAALAGAEVRPAEPLVFRLPLLLMANGLPTPDMNGPLSVSLKWHGPIDSLWRLVPMPDRTFTGLAAMDLAVSGSMASPVVDGSAYLAKAVYEDKIYGLLLTDINLEAKASHEAGFRLVMAARDGGKGRMGLEGDWRPGEEEPLSLRGQILHMAPVHRDDLNITVSGLMSVKGSMIAPLISADVLVERGEVLLLSTLSTGSVSTLDIAEAGTDPTIRQRGPRCQINIDIPRRFFVRGHGLDSEWQGKLNIVGYLSEPALTGTLKPVRGTFDLMSKTFAFTGGEITFAGGNKINPGINLELTYKNPSLEAIVRAGGTMSKPTLTLESQPPLPQDEIMAQVLFGKNASGLSRFEALQLANGLRELAGVGGAGLNPLTTMRKAIGLDVLRVGSTGDDANSRHDSGLSGAGNVRGMSSQSQSGSSDDTSSATLEAGQYINDSIYIGVEQGLTQEETAVRVEIEILPNMTLQGRTSTQSSQAGLGWKMDY